MANDVDLDAKRSKLEATEIKWCFIHFKDVLQSLTLVSETRLKKFVSCRKRWAAIDGEKADLCRESYEIFSDEECCQLICYAHEKCYKRICDENKLLKAEEKFKSTPQSTTAAALTSDETQKRKSTRLQMQSEAAVRLARNEHVHPVQCIICCRDTDQFVMVSMLIFTWLLNFGTCMSVTINFVKQI